MNQNEFEKLAISEVKSLNGHQDQENVLDAWKAGYIYLKEEIEKSFRNDFHEEFLTKVEEIIDQQIDVFE